MKTKILILTLALFLVPYGSDARIYKWRDNTGKLHFTDSINKIPPQYRKNLKTPKRTKETSRQSKKNPPSLQSQAPSPAPEPEIGTVDSRFTMTSWNGNKINIYDFEVGYWKDNTKKLKTNNPIPYRPGYHLGARFKIKKNQPDEPFTIALHAVIPLKGKNGRVETFGVTTTHQTNNDNSFEYVSIEFDQDRLEKLEIPGNWTIKFENNNRFFRSRNIRVTNP